MPDRVGLVRRIWAGSERRKSRLHDELGNRVSSAALIRNGPRAISGGIGRKLFGYRPPRPWIAYSAQPVIGRLLTRQSAMLEFGSGKSTRWYADRAGQVWSVELDPHWHAIVRRELSGCDNVELLLATSREDYFDMVPDRAFDFIMIDGAWREDCAQFAVRHLAPGGAIYLDNSDMNPGDLTGNVPAARQILLDFAQDKGLRVRIFTDFAPTQFHVQQGMLVGG
ncbi:MAG TPA: class I SAM-dependent methyltransferase [Sphingomonadaceae bacterium]|nr:class I SAM-dependent methyltransferase [Sphingomonadaceae bacterium]